MPPLYFTFILFLIPMFVLVCQLYNEAPRPLRVDVNADVEKLPYYGSEYHGELCGREAEVLLQREGQYLVRKRRKQRDVTLSFRVNGTVHHYHLFYDGKYYIRPDKKFATLTHLVTEGLLIKFMDRNADSYLRVMPTLPSLPTLQIKEVRRTKSLNLKQTNQHEFRTTYFVNCECSRFWVKGEKCKQCGAVYHCSKSILTVKCIPVIPLFGAPLTAKEFHIDSRPFILDMCLEEVERRGLDAEGIYRVSGFSDEVEKLSMEFETKKSETKITTHNIHVITGVFKRWLRQLPLPIIPSDIDSLSSALKLDEPLPQVKATLKRLPPVHYDCLKRVIGHMTRVALKKEDNLMTPHNLAVIFGPTLVLITGFDTIDRNISIVHFLIVNCHNIFT